MKGFVASVCRVGKGAKCCRYLCLDEHGFCCGKLSALRPVIDARVAAGTMRAMGDHCSGMPQETSLDSMDAMLRKVLDANEI